MNRLFLLFFALLLSGSTCFAKDAVPGTPTVSGIQPAAASLPPPPMSLDMVMEQGKTLFDNGEYLPALDKFMKVLRRDPRNPEAREYVRRIVDQMRRTPGSQPPPMPERMASPTSTPARPLPAAASPVGLPASAQVNSLLMDEEVQRRVRQRHILTMDLKAIAGVKVDVNSKQAQIEIDTPLLFTDKTGGLREEGILILDRAAAWLRTFGVQPIVIHSYPEELSDDPVTSALFLHRYAQLYGFFVEEKKIQAVRFISTGLPKDTKKSRSKAEPESAPLQEILVSVSSAAPRVIIVSLGGGALPDDAESRSLIPKWLEFSITPSHNMLNPDDGDWTNLDLAALTRKGLRSWNFKISPAAQRATVVLGMDGKGNLLKRVGWDGRDRRSGSFVAAGKYVAKLSATDSDGTANSAEITLEVKRSAVVAEPAKPKAAAAKPKPASAAKSTAAPAPKPAAAPSAPKPPVALPPTEAGPLTNPAATAPPVPAPPLLPPKAEHAERPVPAEPPAEAEPADPVPELEEEPAESASNQAIWKQVIQFDPNESDLKPTLKASLERISKTLEVYPLQKVHIVGFASGSEANAAQLARQRADEIRRTLINEYQVDGRRVVVTGGKVGSGAAMSKVEISITN